MMKLLLTALIALGAVPALAGGVRCQLDGTCGCILAKCGNDGNSEVPEPIYRGPTIECKDGQGAWRVSLAVPIRELPREGEIPARFENVALPYKNSVTTSITPPFHMRAIRILTAYCSYGIQIDSAGENSYFVFQAAAECEGVHHALDCKIL